jgi:hypothetical protein
MSSFSLWVPFLPLERYIIYGRSLRFLIENGKKLNCVSENNMGWTLLIYSLTRYKFFLKYSIVKLFIWMKIEFYVCIKSGKWMLFHRFLSRNEKRVHFENATRVNVSREYLEHNPGSFLNVLTDNNFPQVNFWFEPFEGLLSTVKDVNCYFGSED